jgi:hypothetical protein
MQVCQAAVQDKQMYPVPACIMHNEAEKSSTDCSACTSRAYSEQQQQYVVHLVSNIAAAVPL